MQRDLGNCGATGNYVRSPLEGEHARLWRTEGGTAYPIQMSL